MCCVWQVRWIRCGSRLMWIDERRFKFYWSHVGDDVCVMGLLLNEEFFLVLLSLKRMSGGVMLIMLVFEEGVPGLIRYALHTAWIFIEIERFSDEFGNA